MEQDLVDVTEAMRNHIRNFKYDKNHDLQEICIYETLEALDNHLGDSY